MAFDCPLAKPACKKNVTFGKTPFEKNKCPLNALLNQGSGNKSTSKYPLSSSKCSLTSYPSVNNPKGGTCPFSFPSSSCPLSPPKCPLIPEPCPLSSPKCPLVPETCPLSPPKCPLIPEPCPLAVPQQPQCPLLPSKCPLRPPTSKDPPSVDICPVDNPSDLNSPCPHMHFLNKGLNRKPASVTEPPPICHKIARKCPFEPVPMVCHETCPCTEIPEVESGPRCPFLPPEPECPPLCPLKKQPDCPLVQKPRCMWEPISPPACPLTTSSNDPRPTSSCGCPLKDSDVCPSFLKIPGNKTKERQKPKTSNIQCCPFCDDKVARAKPVKPDRSFHFPSCPMFEPPCRLQSLPRDKPACPFYPCPCPLTGSGDCPMKVPPLETSDRCKTTSSDIRPENSIEEQARNKPHTGCTASQPCPLVNLRCSVQAPNCPLANFKCPPPPPPPEPPCPIKGCLKKPSAKNPSDCPGKTDSCAMFPEGRCPGEDLGLCDCDYPVPPCMVDMKKSTIRPPSQFCLKDDCCMGLPDPPIIESTSNDSYYSYVALHPDSESTKYYIEISDSPPDALDPMDMGAPKHKLLPQCSIVKFGDGYKQCRTVKGILEKRGSCSDSCSQYSLKDCPVDEMARRIKASNKKNTKVNQY